MIQWGLRRTAPKTPVCIMSLRSVKRVFNCISFSVDFLLVNSNTNMLIRRN